MQVYSRSSYLSLPSKPGVYLFLAEDNSVIYVGKAIDLKSRVSSYFSTSQLGVKTKVLVSLIKKIKVTVVESELEALLLEAFYIKNYNPKYNIRLTDGKAYILVRITNAVRITNRDSYPKILLARKADDPDSLYFGPFPNSSAVKIVLRTVRKVFPYQSVLNHPKRLCLYNHLGLCPCPPVNDTPALRREYLKNIRGIIRVFHGEVKKIIKEFEKKRDNYSANEDFELAAIYQFRIRALSYITQPFHKPAEYALNPNLRSDIRQDELTDLKNILTDNGYPVNNLQRIECYDISHIQGTNTTASMVVFQDGEKESGQYRKFKIRLEKTPDDFASMKEVLTRRFRHNEWPRPGLLLIDGGKGQVSAALEVIRQNEINIPLIGLAKREETIVIPLPVSIDPNNLNQRISKEIQFKEVSLPRNSKALLLIMRIRDEAHRFAVTYHRKLRSKKAIG